MPTQQEKAAFGRRLRDLCDDNRWTAPKLAARLTGSTDLPDYKVSDASVKLWWAGKTAPKQRAVVEYLDELLGAGGELLAILGLVPNLKLVAHNDDMAGRLEALESEVAHIKKLVEQVVARPPRSRRGRGEATP